MTVDSTNLFVAFRKKPHPFDAGSGAVADEKNGVQNPKEGDAENEQPTD